MKVKSTNNGKKGGLLKGKPHYDKDGNSLGGIKAIVTDTKQIVELEGGEVIINKEASKKHWKELSKINQSAGDGVPILPPGKMKRGGELAKGIKTELEHSKTIKKIAKEDLTPKEGATLIAKDHLAESNKYYSELKKMESKFKKGKTISQTVAPKSERVFGSDVNKKGSSKDSNSAKEIKFSDKTLKSIESIINEHNKQNPLSKINLDTAKAVVRRGMGAYSVSHRPTITGGKPNSRVAWGLARLNAFVYKVENKKSKSGKYVQDDDLIKNISEKFSRGGVLSDEEKNEIYKKWKDLVNMSSSELKSFMNSEEGKKAGLSKEQANKLGIHYGRESARWILKMKETPRASWTPKMWEWANRQISFNSRMRGNQGALYDEKGNKTRKHLSLLIWGHNPKKYEQGGIMGDVFSIKDPEQFKQIITLYNKFSEKFSIDNYFIDDKDNSVVFLRKVKFTPTELKEMSKHIADLSKNKNFNIISDKQADISNGYFKFFLNEKVKYAKGGLMENEPTNDFENVLWDELADKYYEGGSITSVYKSKSEVINTILEKTEPKLEELLTRYIQDENKQGRRVDDDKIKMIKLHLILPLVKALGKYIKDDDKLNFINVEAGKGGTIEIKSFIIRDGKSYKFYTNMIVAEGLIQKAHYRYLIDTNLPYNKVNEAENEIKEKIRRITKLESYTNELNGYKTRLAKTIQEVEEHENKIKGKTDEEIYDILIKEAKEKAEQKGEKYFVWEKWEELEDYTKENFNNDKKEYEEYLLEQKKSQIQRYKDEKILDKNWIKTVEKEIKKLEEKIAELTPKNASEDEMKKHLLFCEKMLSIIDEKDNKTKYEEGGSIKSNKIICANCKHSWHSHESEEHDTHVCHKCGHDNKEQIQVVDYKTIKNIDKVDKMENSDIFYNEDIFVSNRDYILGGFNSQQLNKIKVVGDKSILSFTKLDSIFTDRLENAIENFKNEIKLNVLERDAEANIEQEIYDDITNCFETYLEIKAEGISPKTLTNQIKNHSAYSTWSNKIKDRVDTYKNRLTYTISDVNINKNSEVSVNEAEEYTYNSTLEQMLEQLFNINQENNI